MSEDTLAMGAKSLAGIKEAMIPSKDGAAVVAEGMRQGFRPSELADLARDIKRHGQDFREGRITTESIRDQISRGDRGGCSAIRIAMGPAAGIGVGIGWGLDTISTGNTIGCAMELAERGLVTSELRFGRADLLYQTIQDIAYRNGLGDELAEGSYRFAAMHSGPEYSMTVKKLELPAYDPRGMQGQGLLYATSNRGACHMRGNMLGPEVLALPRLINRFANQGKAGIVSVHQNEAAVVDSLVVCRFTAKGENRDMSFLANGFTETWGTATETITVPEDADTLQNVFLYRSSRA